MTLTMKARPSECAYSFIADAGEVTLERVTGFFGLDEVLTHRWLRRRAGEGYLFRDEFGSYSASCPWPRAGL